MPLPRATAEITEDDEGIHVTVVWDATVDRNRIDSWLLPKGSLDLARRLKRAVDAQAVVSEPRVEKDVNGATYVDAGLSVMGRTMSADLKRLGF